MTEDTQETQQAAMHAHMDELFKPKEDLEGPKCPFCRRGAVSRCKCRIGHRTCARGHDYCVDAEGGTSMLLAEVDGSHPWRKATVEEWKAHGGSANKDKFHEKEAASPADYSTFRQAWRGETDQLPNEPELQTVLQAKPEIEKSGPDAVPQIDPARRVKVLMILRNIKRDYGNEYKSYHGTPEQIARRASRNKARRIMQLLGKVPVDSPEPVDVDHIDRNPMNNDPANLRALPVYENRSRLFNVEQAPTLPETPSQSGV